ncbi:MAG: Na+/H+ antiporter subunit E [Planctomycetota bacterium]|nr:Na+/H+ antiporter subunit E [Planctomycetota bacterium]
MNKVLSAFVFNLLVWLAVTWTFDPVSLAIGAVLAAAIAFALRNVELEEVPLLLMPHRLLWALLYIPVLFLYVVRANLDVAWRVLHPALPIRPGIVKARTTLKSPGARVLLANSITLTPGTLSVDVVDDTFYVHRIHVPEDDPDGDMERSMGRFESYLRRIFE